MNAPERRVPPSTQVEKVGARPWFDKAHHPEPVVGPSELELTPMPDAGARPVDILAVFSRNE